jgi:hypothetical protein
MAVLKEISKDSNLNNPTLVMEFATFSLDSFRVATAIIQHFCARIDRKQMNSIADVIERGLYVLYDYVYYYWAGYNEELIIESIRSHLPAGVKIVPLEEAFTKATLEFRESILDRHRSVDHGAPALFVDTKEENALAEEVSKIVKPPSVVKSVNISYFSNSSRATVESTPVVSQTTNMGPKIIGKTRVVHVNPELQEKLFPKNKQFPTNPAMSYTYLFTMKHGEKAAIPSFVIKVPWLQALGIMGRHENYYTEDGFVFLDYTQIAVWMRDTWHSAVIHTRRWDEEKVIWPWLDYEYAKYQDVIPMNIDMMYTEFLDFLKGFNERTFFGPLKQSLRNGLFSSIEEDPNEPTPYADYRLVVPYLYAPVFEHGRRLESQLRARLLMARQNAAQSGASNDIPSENEIFYQPLEANVTGNFFEDYGRIMPPCIKNMYESHMNNHTHFKNDERLKFFWWSFKASIPLEIVMDMWTVMLDNDTAIPQREREAVKREGKNLYLKHQRSRESGNEYNYFGCVKMASYCPFVNTQPSASQSIGDIEDLGKEIRDRKIHCGNNLWEKKTPVHSTGLAVKKWPDRHLRIWSPMTATAVLANYYLNKI